jgi:glyoxylase-like metal-dependent hydrolase (beta-lactamase superfamily II)
VEVQRLADGLWRWAARHPTFDDPTLGTDVGCVYVETEEAVVLIDPLVPGDDDERKRFLAALDRDVEQLGRPVTILLTCSWHARSADELRERYTTTDERPPAVVSHAVANDEVAYWLEPHRALVTGDALLGLGGLRRCPDAWLEDRGGSEKLVAALRGLVELEPVFVLPSHGDPVVEDATRALADAIEAPPFE